MSDSKKSKYDQSRAKHYREIAVLEFKRVISIMQANTDGVSPDLDGAISLALDSVQDLKNCFPNNDGTQSQPEDTDDHHGISAVPNTGHVA